MIMIRHRTSNFREVDHAHRAGSAVDDSFGYSPEDEKVRVPPEGGPSAQRRRGYSLESVRVRVRVPERLVRGSVTLGFTTL